MSGAPEVGGNAAAMGKNIYLRAYHNNINSNVMMITGALTGGASLHVTKAGDSMGTITSGYSTYNGNTSPSQFFHADSGSYGIALVEGEAKLSNAGSFTISYIKRAWNGTAVTEQTATIDASPVPNDGKMVSGWYYLSSDIAVNGRIESITGDVNLILADGYTLNVK